MQVVAFTNDHKLKISTSFVRIGSENRVVWELNSRSKIIVNVVNELLQG